MFLSELNIWNFRKIGIKTEGDEEKPGLTLSFNKGLNLIVGENDSGKTAIIDSIKFVLLTQSNDYLRIDYEDFYVPEGDESRRAERLCIECIFRDFSIDEAKNFLEWLNFEDVPGAGAQYVLRVRLEAKRKHRNIYYDIRAGMDGEGKPLNGEARDLLRTTFLKPLRDAENELAPKRNSRLSQILDNHKAFQNKDDHLFLEAIAQANKVIQNYFQGLDANEQALPDDENGKALLDEINNYLKEFSATSEGLSSSFWISDLKLKNILEKLSLNISLNKPGLGSNNLLFIATELLLLNRESFEGLKLALIEEIEAHLHPQAQLRLIEFLQRESDRLGIQLILTSHSPNIASKVKLENLILCHNTTAFPLGKEHTELLEGDYSFLERFLDATKANLFFAQGIILVEGDAENLIIPAIAEVIDKPLAKYGVSIVNVGSTAFLRYARIFKRKDEAKGTMEIPVAVITDNDLKPDLYKEVKSDSKTIGDYILEEYRANKEALYNGQTVKTFISPHWTFEYDTALGGFAKEIYLAVLYAKAIQNSNKIGLTPEKIQEISANVDEDMDRWNQEGWDIERIAFEIYNNVMLKSTNKISKAITAQCLAKILLEMKDREALKQRILKDEKLRYIVDAIKYVTKSAGNEDV